MSSSPPSDHWARNSSLWLPLLLAAGARLVLIAAGPAPETWEYDTIARHLLAGDGYVYEHFGQPHRAYYSGAPYVALTAAAYALWPATPKAMLLIQTLVSLATVAVVVRLGSRLAGPRAGLVAGVLAALHPALVYYDVRNLHPLGLDALLSVAPIVLLLPPIGRRRVALAGMVLGLGVLQRGSLLPFAVLTLVWIAAQEGPRRERALRAGLFVLTAALVLTPWLCRNQQIFGRPLLGTGNGYRFFIGNVPPSQGSALLPSGEAVMEHADPELRRALPALDEAGQDRLFWEHGLAFVRTRPAAFARQVARKLLSFWTWTPAAGALYPTLYRHVYLAFYGGVVLASAVGLRRLAAAVTARRVLLPIAAMFLSVSLVHAVFYVELRHRWAIEPLLLVLAAVGVAGIRRPATETG